MQIPETEGNGRGPWPYTVESAAKFMNENTGFTMQKAPNGSYLVKVTTDDPEKPSFLAYWSDLCVMERAWDFGWDPVSSASVLESTQLTGS